MRFALLRNFYAIITTSHAIIITIHATITTSQSSLRYQSSIAILVFNLFGILVLFIHLSLLDFNLANT